MSLRRTAKGIIRRSLGFRSDTDFYSQGGEDAIVSNTFLNALGKHTGVYVDIGAYHPFKHSNTYLLYKSGWKGVNIDPRPGTKKLFDRYRDRDINIEAGIGSDDGKLLYFVIDDDSTMNTFSKENLERLGLLSDVKKTIDVRVYSMQSLAREIPLINEADYLNIDAEGFELEILKGNDFGNCAPTIISIEQNGVSTLSDVLGSPTANYLAARHYVPFAKNLILSSVATVFYVKDGVLNK